MSEQNENIRSGAVQLPVYQELLDETAGGPQSEPYPALTPEQEQAAQTEREVAEQVVTVRGEQALNIANMGQDGAPHFLVNVEGKEVCGSCGKPFPCPSWVDDIGPANEAASAGQAVPDEDKARAVAELLGVPIEQARQMVLLSTPLDKIGG